MKIEVIKQLCESDSLRFTNHIMIRLIQRNISIEELKHAILNGEIIEVYPDDYPHPSCLILGFSIKEKHLHVVCGINYEELYLITAYFPDPEKWAEDFKERKEK